MTTATRSTVINLADVVRAALASPVCAEREHSAGFVAQTMANGDDARAFLGDLMSAGYRDREVTVWAGTMFEHRAIKRILGSPAEIRADEAVALANFTGYDPCKCHATQVDNARRFAAYLLAPPGKPVVERRRVIPQLSAADRAVLRIANDLAGRAQSAQKMARRLQAMLDAGSLDASAAGKAKDKLAALNGDMKHLCQQFAALSLPDPSLTDSYRPLGDYGDD